MTNEQLLFNALMQICRTPNKAYEIAEAAIVEHKLRQQNLSFQNYRGSDFCKLICQSNVSLNNHDFSTTDAKVILEMWLEAMPIKAPRTDYLLCERIISRLNNKSYRVKTKVRDIYEFAHGLTKFDFYYEDLIG